MSLLDLVKRIEHGTGVYSVDYVIVRLRQLSRHLLRLGGVKNLTEQVRNSLVAVSSLLPKVEKQQSRPNVVAAKGSGFVGRLRLEITAEQLEYLFGYDLTFRDIGEALRVSERRVRVRYFC